MLDPKSPKAPYKQNSHLQSGTAKKDMEMPSASTAEKVMEMPSVLRSNVLRIKKNRARVDQSTCWMSAKLEQSWTTMLTIAHVSHNFLRAS
jgi:hypothetical protein